MPPKVKHSLMVQLLNAPNMLESTGMLNPALLIPALPDPDPDPNPENSNVSSNTSDTNMHSMNECMNSVEQEFYQNVCSGQN